MGKIKRLICWLLWHRWVQDRGVHQKDFYESPWNPKPPTKRCSMCDKHETWVAGARGWDHSIPKLEDSYALKPPEELPEIDGKTRSIDVFGYRRDGHRILTYYNYRRGT